MNTAKGLCCTLAMTFSLMGYAGDSGQPHNQWYANIGMGIGEGRGSNDMLLINNGSDFPGSASFDGYQIDSFAKSPNLMIEAGRRWQRGTHWLPAYSLGLRYQHHFSRHISGTVMEFMLPEFVNYRFNLSSVSNELRLNAKLNIIEWHQILPYVNLGIGANHHQVKNYEEQALANVTPRFSPAFANRSRTSATYAIGAGIDWLPGQNVIISMGYEYQQVGQLKTGFGANSWSLERLDFSNLYSNNLLMQFGLLFD